ncbi:hypothetical protein GCM10010129_79310 [Streptomyces fumigatiscleroticus]|nr:hypothetical protein GCM10010129_79310 [Streptomyces fumigatiscleroticus]
MLAYDRRGRGPGLVLLPGLGSSATDTWGSLVDALAAEYTVVLPDLPGSGRTPLPGGRRTAKRGCCRPSPVPAFPDDPPQSQERTLMHVHFLVHEAFEAPGAYARWALDRGYTVTYSRLYAGERLPPAAGDIDLLIVMGGPQSPATTTAECPHFDAAAEMSLITSCAAAGKAVVGVCLGAQLLGEALGAPCLPSPEPEVGSFPVTLTEAGRQHPLFRGFDETFDTGHWHRDMPGLTADAAVLARSDGCPRQIVAYGRFLYGFQCHMEFDRDIVESLIASAKEEIAALRGHRFVQQPEELRRTDHRATNQRLELFLDRLAADYTAA